MQTRLGGLLGSRQCSFPAASAVPSLSAMSGEESSAPACGTAPERVMPRASLRHCRGTMPSAGGGDTDSAAADGRAGEPWEGCAGSPAWERSWHWSNGSPPGAGAASATQAEAPVLTNSFAIPAQPACTAPKQADRK